MGRDTLVCLQAPFSVPEARVGVWQGFVYINPDRDAEPLSDFLGDLGSQAFMESYQVVATQSDAELIDDSARSARSEGPGTTGGGFWFVQRTEDPPLLPDIRQVVKGRNPQRSTR